MKANKFKQALTSGVLALLVLVMFSCKDQLQVGNPNAPTLGGNVTSESGVISLAQGAVYINGFQNAEKAPGATVLGDTFFDLGYGYIDEYGDMLTADAANNLISVCNQPDYVILDNATKISQSSSSLDLLRNFNTRAATGAGNNILYFQWRTAYDMNNGCNIVLSKVDGLPFSGDKDTKVNTLKAWSYWWKGYAYALIGNMYYSGLIIDKASSSSSVTNGNYVLHDGIIAASNKYYKKADSVLSLATSTSDYNEVMSKLIPAFFQAGHGNPPSVDEWKRNINTMLARNLLLSKLSPFVNGNLSSTITKSSTTVMSASDWNDVLTLANAGLKAADNSFTGRSTSTNPVFTTSTGTIAAHSTGASANSTYKICERLIQNFNPGDNRLQNFTEVAVTDNTFYANTFFGSRFSLNDAGKIAVPSGTYQYSNLTTGSYELYIGASYEENQLMIAEAKIRLATSQAQIDDGLTYVDAVRAYMGAGVPAVSGTGLNQTQAMKELVKERRVALVFRGVSFYDARRWGWIYDIANGGGSYGNTFIDAGGNINTNATINFNFLDYWDVPADESDLNPSTNGVATKNPNF